MSALRRAGQAHLIPVGNPLLVPSLRPARFGTMRIRSENIPAERLKPSAARQPQSNDMTPDQPTAPTSPSDALVCSRSFEWWRDCHDTDPRMHLLPTFELMEKLEDVAASLVDGSAEYRNGWTDAFQEMLSMIRPANVRVHTPLPASASDETGVKP